MKNFIALCITSFLAFGLVWAEETTDEENTQSTNTTFKPYEKKNKKHKSGVFAGVDAGLGVASASMKPMDGLIETKEGSSISISGDLKVGYKHYITKEFAVRGYANVGAGIRTAAATVSGFSTITQNTTSVKLGLGADVMYDLSSGFGVFAGFGIENYSWTHSINYSSYSVYKGANSESTGNTFIPRLQAGVMFNGLEVGLVYYTSKIQPSDGILNYSNDIALRVGYSYTF